MRGQLSISQRSVPLHFWSCKGAVYDYGSLAHPYLCRNRQTLPGTGPLVGSKAIRASREGYEVSTDCVQESERRHTKWRLQPDRRAAHGRLLRPDAGLRDQEEMTR